MSSGKKRVLLVDDDQKILKLVSTQLERLGYEVMTAPDGQEGLSKARIGHPDVIILDVMLPKMNGYEVCTTLKRNPLYMHIPIILCTAQDRDLDEAVGRECGANAYLTKPHRFSDLVEQIEALLGTVSPNDEPMDDPELPRG